MAIFMVTLVVVHFLWKWTFTGDEEGGPVTWLGLDVTAPFAMVSHHIASVVYWLVSLCRDTAHMVGDYTIRFDSGYGTSIVWGCSGLKQAFIWLCLMLTVMPEAGSQPSAVRRMWLHKLWYIPVGWVCCYAFNIFRIFLIALAMENHHEWFYLLHDVILKGAFYAMLFGLWALFVGKIRPRA